MTTRGPAEAFPPGEFLKDELDERGWTQAEFAAIIGRTTAVVNQIISGRRGITPETAQELGAALGQDAMYWMNLDSSYRLWRAGPVRERIRQKARLRELFPVREMAKRGWIDDKVDHAEVQAQVLRFFGIKDIEERPRLALAAKRTTSMKYPDDLNGAQLAWLFRVRQIASVMPTQAYSEKRLRETLARLAELRGSPDGIRQVPKLLAECGVRFVIVQHVPSSKIDGVCFWIGGQPVIGMSLRLDRLDNFWFVLRHEIEHVLHKHGTEEAIVDRDMYGTEGDEIAPSREDEERIADEAAADFCVPTNDMDDFIVRYHPLYKEDLMVSFAQRMMVDPALVVGQIQKRTGLWKLFRRYLVPVRDIVAPVAMTDGYGQMIPLDA